MRCMATRIGAVLTRLGLVLLGIVLGLVALEATLQILAAAIGASPRDPLPWVHDKWRVLSLGDSNTYGLSVEKAQAYPKVFESLWNAQPGNAPIEVLNLGFPGTNSSKLVKEFHRILWTFRPDMVTVMIGANDLWTVPETAADSPSVIDRAAAALWKVSRVYRLLYMAERAIQRPELEITLAPAPESIQRDHATVRYGHSEFELGWVPRSDTGLPSWHPYRDLQHNLLTLANEARGFHVQMIFLTYPAETTLYGLANQMIRRAAKAAAVPLIDLGAAFRPACPDGHCAELLPDQHPSALGHERAARLILGQFTIGPARASDAEHAPASAD